jgi:hypothetical protein
VNAAVDLVALLVFIGVLALALVAFVVVGVFSSLGGDGGVTSLA